MTEITEKSWSGLQPGWPIKVLRMRPAMTGFAANSQVEAVEVWMPAKFVRWDKGKFGHDEYPIIEWPDGTLEKLKSRNEIK